MENSNYKLTCGVFFSFLCHIQLPRKKASEHYFGVGDDLTDSLMMYEMIAVIKEPSSSNKFDTGTINKFKLCSSSSLGWFDWNDDKTIKFFDRQMHYYYSKTKNAMMSFINKTIDTTGENKEWLVASLLKIIDGDQSLNDKLFFYNRKELSKSDFINQESYDFTAFLLSILHVIVINKIKNTPGKSTMDLIAPSSGGSKRPIDNSFPGDDYWKLKITFENQKNQSQLEEPETDDANEDDDEIIEVIEDTPTKNENDGSKVQNIQHATINNVSGDQYNISGNLIINKK